MDISLIGRGFPRRLMSQNLMQDDAKRITVQIDPAARAAAAAKVDTGPAVAATPSGAIAPLNAGQFDWFWDKVSPAADRGGAGRLAPAMAALSTPKALKLINLQL